MLKRKLSTINEKKAKKRKGGGESLVEKRKSMSIESLYSRMLANNEIQTGMALKANKLDKKSAVKLLQSAKEAPLYQHEQKIKEHAENIQLFEGEVDKNNKEIKKMNKKFSEEERINNEVEKRLNEKLNKNNKGGKNEDI